MRTEMLCPKLKRGYKDEQKSSLYPYLLNNIIEGVKNKVGLVL